MTHGPITRHASAWAIGLMQIRVGACAANIANITPILTSTHSIGAMASTKYTGSAEFFKQMSGFPEREDGSIPLREMAAIECAFKEITPYNMAIARGLDPTASVAAAATKSVKINSALGTVATDVIAVSGTGDWGVVDEEYTVVFTGATAGKIYGKNSGVVHTFVDLTTAMAPVNTDTEKLFSIPANFFTGTWAADDTYVFYTHAGGASLYSEPHVGSMGLGGLVAPVNIRVEAVYTFPNGVNTMTIVLPRAQVVAQMELDTNAEDAAAPPITIESKNASSDNAVGNLAWDAMPLGRFIWA